MRLHIFISGKVQGVFFRQFTIKAADEYGIRGWVRNTEDDRVEIVAEGRPEQFMGFIQKLKNGTEHSKVRDIEVSEESETGEFDSFERK